MDDSRRETAEGSIQDVLFEAAFWVPLIEGEEFGGTNDE